MALGPGSIAFVGYNADGSDNLAFVALEEISAGQTIYFSDNEWTGSGWDSTNENHFSWTASSTVAAGTIVRIDSIGTGTATSNLGSVTIPLATGGTNRGFSTDGDTIYAYTADAGTPLVPTAFLSAVTSLGYSAAAGVLTGTGLTVGVNAIDIAAIDPGADIAAYNGSRNSETDFESYRAVINNTANWLTQDASGDQSIDGTAPDAPFPTTAFTVSAIETQSVGFEALTVSQNEGNSGTTSYTFTVTRSGGTTGVLDFSGTVALGGTDATDYQGGTAPTTFSGSIAAGATSQTVTISVAGDATIETNENFSLTLTSVTNQGGISASINSGSASATGTIVNDDAAVPNLAAGDIAFTGFNADGNDNLSFVALKAIAAGDTIYFQDNEWTGAAFNTGESAFSWTASSSIAAGTVITIDDISTGAGTSNLGTLTYIDSSNLGISNSGEIVYAFTGASATAPSTFLAAIANGSFTTSGATLTGTGLTDGVNAIDLLPLSAGGADVATYTGARNSQTSFAGYAAVLNDEANWNFQDASGDQSADGIGPDVPFSTTAFSLAGPTETQTIGFANLNVARIEQDGGETTTFTFTVNRSGGTTGELNFTGSIDLGGTDAVDFGGSAPTSFSGTIAAGATSGTVTVSISGDTTVETDETFSLTLSGGTGAPGVTVAVNSAAATANALIRNDDAGQTIGGITVYDAAASLEGDATPPTASADFKLVRLGSIAGSPAGSEVVAFEDGIAYNMNNIGTQIDKFSVNANGTLSQAGTIDFTGLPDFGGGNSVAVKDGLLAFAYNSATFGNAGHVALINAETGALIKVVDVGVGPDQITFSLDGTKLLTADEAERLNPTDNFAGSVSVIDLSGGAANATVSNTIGFDALNGSEYALINRGVAIAAGQTASNDIEPEYVAVSPDGTRAYVTLQEVNAVAVIDLTDPSATKPISIQPLGSIDRSLLGNAFDGNDQNGISIGNFDVASLPQPDAIASFSVGGVTYFVTANEGDARVGLIDEARLSTLNLDPTAYPDAAAIKAAIGRLNVITTAGDTDGDGDIDQITTFGGRGISIFKQNADGTIEKVRETGGEFEAIIARDFPAIHNSENLDSVDSRSDNKGPEPEGVAVGQVGDRLYAFVNLERVGGVMVYDITDPAHAEFVTYRPATNQDFAPEVTKFIGAGDSPTEGAMVLTANEVSNTVTAYSVVSQTDGDDTLVSGSDSDSFNGKGGNDLLIGNGGNDTLDGGADTDTAAYAGAWVGYDVTNGGATVTDINTANGNDGTDTLNGVENLRFHGMVVAAADAVNDAPIGTNDNNVGDALIEDADASAAGNVLSNDIDADLALGLGETLTVIGAHAGGEASGASYAAVSGATVIDGTYGELTINPDGTFSYALDNSRAATEALATGQTVNDVFSYQVTDAHGLIDMADLTFAISGHTDSVPIVPIVGTAAIDTLNGTAGDDIIKGLAGNDKLFGNGGNDVLMGGPGKDTLNGGEGIDTVDYSEAVGPVRLALGSSGSVGEAMGDKFISIENFRGSAFDDYVNGTAGDNRMDGGDGADFLSGLNGNDQLFGDGGKDVLSGGAGTDLLNGGAGGDLLIGGVGFDNLIGGEGNDIFEARLIDIKGDRIQDFGEGDGIRVVGLNPSAVTVSWAVGVLSIDPDGAGKKVATTLQLDGVFDNAHFHVTNDGLGNTLITYSETVI